MTISREYNLLMKKALLAITLAEQVECVSSLVLSGKLSEEESEVIKLILQEKLSVLVDTSSSIQSSIAFDFPLKNEINTEAQDIASKNTFGERLKFALKEQGMTQGVLADWTGVSQGAISSYVTGRVKEAGITRARLMAQALKVRAVWLIHGEGEMSLASNFSNHSDEV